MKSCPTCKATYPSDFSLCPRDGATLRSTTELAIGAILRGKYEVLAKLGEGGMGAVYKVRNVHFDEVGALKIVSAKLLEDSAFIQRFRSEALVMRRLAHPHAVRVQDFDETDDGRPFMVMECVEGRSLDAILADGPFPPHRAVNIAVQVCEALEAAHQLGIIHRDIKPSNIMVSRGPDGCDFVKVFDFGIAKIKEGSKLHGGHSLTQTGFVVGTPAYMSPEQCQGLKGDRLDGRTDLYSLGIVLYECLAGRTPFQAESSVELLVAHIQAKPPDPREIRAELPPELVSIVLQALEKDPARRFGSADEMRDALLGTQMATGPAAQETVPVLRAPRTPSKPVTVPPGATTPFTPVPAIAAPSLVTGPMTGPNVSPPPVPDGSPTVPVATSPAAAHAAPARSSKGRWVFAIVAIVVILSVAVGLGLYHQESESSGGSDIENLRTGGGQPSSLPASTDPQAARVFQRYIDAMGGPVFHTWQNYSGTGDWSYSEGTQSTAGTFEFIEQTPARIMQKNYVQNQLISRQASDGTSGWRQEGSNPVEYLTPREVTEALRDSTFFRVLRTGELYSSLQSAGTASVNGRPVNVLKAGLVSGSTDTLYFDSETGLLLRRDGTEEMDGRQVTTQKYYSDYRPSCGGQLPWTETISAGDLTFIYRFTQVRCSIPLDASAFLPPRAATAPDRTPAPSSGLASGSLKGEFAGTVKNLTIQVSSDFAVAWNHTGRLLIGCMVVEKPLAGSGPLLGTVEGNTVRFRVTAAGMILDFQGERDGNDILGTYTASGSGFQPQRGQFGLRKQSGNLPAGFNASACPRD